MSTGLLAILFGGVLVLSAHPRMASVSSVAPHRIARRRGRHIQG